MKGILPVLAWMLWLPLAGSAVLQSNRETALIVFAAWVLVPAGLRLLKIQVNRLYWPTVAALSLAYAFPDVGTFWRGMAAVPYAAWATWIAIREATQLFTLPKIQLIDNVRVVTIGFWMVGAVFSLSFLSGFQPLGFDPVIVSLTAAHFHLAGFVLGVVSYCMLSTVPNGWTRATGRATIAGMPTVAVGIVLTHWGFPPVFEWVAALLFVCFVAAIIAWHFLQVRNNTFPLSVRRYWLFGMICLLAGISLAALYALRFVYPLAWINIPNMKVWHGTLNTLGFAWPVLYGWTKLQP